MREAEGLSVCAAAACTVAALRKLVRAAVVSPGETVLLNLTGGDREPAPPRRYTWLDRADGGWVTRA